ncbi:YbaY family lipoprotein [Aeromonas simiae]|uniref:Glycoprotein-polysaccharide metabolism protein n=1 Tax=Aeromonas simiae TaxID=218936 RepID=A0A5J6WX26_9GAMM|nr:YbaY family lipoprotein [Aeromonas simiae]QFI55200.1 glycoprotein-polysaccharide metabolism protein [Aeromonas simiae]
MRPLFPLALLGSALLLSACNDAKAPAPVPTDEPAKSETSQQHASISGTALYRARMALPPGARLEITLEDVSLADAPARVLGRTTLDELAAPPFAFTLDYDPSKVDQSHRYSVRATIRVGDELLFTTDTFTPALTQGGGDQVELHLVPVAKAPESTAQ